MFSQLGATQADAAETPDGPGAPGELVTFLPAPNPTAYCDSPTYFDAIDQLADLVAAGGNLDVNPSDDSDLDGDPTNDTGQQRVASWTAGSGPGGPTMEGTTVAYDNFEGTTPALSSFTPEIGVVMVLEARMAMALSEPMFYSQWVFNEVDLAAEGFEITPAWVGAPGEVNAFGGDASFDFGSSTNLLVMFNDTDGVNTTGDQLAGRVQVDLMGPISGIDMFKTGQGGAGFSTAGGCEALGVAKDVTSATWDAANERYRVVYTIKAANNMPSTATLTTLRDAALAAAPSSYTSGTSIGYNVEQLELNDLLVTDGFTDVEVVSLVSGGVLTPNSGYDGITDTRLATGATLAPETSETFTLTVDYYPDLTSGSCPQLSFENQVSATGLTAGLTVSDLSDDGTNPGPGNINGAGGVDDPTVVTLPQLDCSGTGITKTTSTPTVSLINPGDSFDVAYDITVANTSDVDITTLPTDDLAATYGASATITNLSLAAGGACAGLENPSFGIGDPRLVNASVFLNQDPQQTCTFSLSFTVTPDPVPNLPATFTNEAVSPSYLLTYDAAGQTTESVSPVITSDTADVSATQVVTTVSGVASVDDDGDGVDDRPIAGMVIELVDADGNVVDTTTTAADGSYSFDGVIAGDYTIEAASPDGYQPSSDADGGADNLIAVTVAGTPITDRDFVLLPLSDIAGTVRVDYGDDGVADAPLTGVTITLLDANGVVVATTTTGANGTYRFVDVRPGTYTVVEIDRDGYSSVGDVDGANDNRISVSPAGGVSVLDRDFLDRSDPVQDDADLDNTIGRAVTVDVTANDGPDVDPTSVLLVDPVSGASVPRVEVAGEGVWTVDSRGRVVFTPAAGFDADPQPIDYVVDHADGKTRTATVTVTYLPTANPDVDRDNTIGDRVTVDVLANDQSELDPATVRLVDPETATLVTSLVVAGQGTWTVDPTTGEVTFTPEPGFKANPTPVTYSARKTGCGSTSTVVQRLGRECDRVITTVTVTYLPLAASDRSDGNKAGTPVTIDPLINDTGTFDRTTVHIIDPGTGERRRTLEVPGEGTWSADPINGTITFTPETGFTGDPTPIRYEVTDIDGQKVQSTAAVTYLTGLPTRLASTGWSAGTAVTVGLVLMMFGAVLVGRRRRPAW